MLLELAIGDAYGAGFEYADKRIILAHNNLSGYIQHPKHHLKPGSYTDDTQMSIAIAEVILSHQPWTPKVLAERFVHCFKRDQRKGYSQRFYQLLQQVQTGQELLERIEPDSDKSGAAMRSAPLGIFPSAAEVIDKTIVQAAITHNTETGIYAAVAAALMSHYFLYEPGPKRELKDFLNDYVPGSWTNQWHGKVGSKGRMSVSAALTAVTTHDSLSKILKACIDFSGDVDTVAAIALAAASCCKEISSDLPKNLYEHLENGPYGREYLQKLDQQLLRIKK